MLTPDEQRQMAIQAQLMQLVENPRNSGNMFGVNPNNKNDVAALLEKTLNSEQYVTPYEPSATQDFRHWLGDKTQKLATGLGASEKTGEVIRRQFAGTPDKMGAADLVPLVGDALGFQDAGRIMEQGSTLREGGDFWKGAAVEGLGTGVGALSALGMLGVTKPFTKAGSNVLKNVAGDLASGVSKGDELVDVITKKNSQPTTSEGYSFDPTMTARNQLERIPDETFDVDADVIYDGARQYKDSTRDAVNKRLSDRGLTISRVENSKASGSQYWHVAPLSDPDDYIGKVRFSDHNDYYGGNDVDIRWGTKPDEITSDILEKINFDNYVPFDERMSRIPPNPNVPKPVVTTPNIRLNDIVEHDNFGRGKVLSVDDNKVEVAFIDGSTKILHSSYLTTLNKGDELVEAISLQNMMKAPTQRFNINTGKKATKLELDPLGYQKRNIKEGYLSDFDVQQTDLGEVNPRFDADVEMMEGGIIIPLFGDRSSTGKNITGIGDITFDKPLNPDGGIDFMLGQSAQADRALWASAPHIMNNIYNQARRLADKTGKDIYGVHVGMGPDGVDFATFAGESMAELMKFAPVKKADALKADEFMKLRDPNWIGVKHPDLRDYISTVKPEVRKSFIRYMDTAPAQAAGFPSPAIARKAVTDVTQFGQATGSAGMATGKIDIDGLIDNPTVPHSTYIQQGTGKYTGQLPQSTAEELWPDDFAVMNKQVDKNRKPLTESMKLYSLKTRLGPQEVTPELVDMLMRKREPRQ